MDGWVVNRLVTPSGTEYWTDVTFLARRLAVEVDGWRGIPTSTGFP